MPSFTGYLNILFPPMQHHLTCLPHSPGGESSKPSSILPSDLSQENPMFGTSQFHSLLHCLLGYFQPFTDVHNPQPKTDKLYEMNEKSKIS